MFGDDGWITDIHGACPSVVAFWKTVGETMGTDSFGRRFSARGTSDVCRVEVVMYCGSLV